jgi:hypothetical protein
MLYTRGMTHPILTKADGAGFDGAACARPLRRSLELNAWLAACALTYLAARYLTKRHPEWRPGLRTALTLMPVLPGLFYLRQGLQLLRALDELQRRIQLEAWLFAAFGTVIVSTVVNVLNAQGIAGVWPPHGLEVGGTYLTMFMLWSVGITIANLRYR